MLKMQQSSLVIAVTFVCLLTGIQGRYLTIGDISIDISNNYFLCDKIECPTGTSRCVVSKELDPENPTILLRSDFCYSSTNEVLKTKVIKTTVDANANVKGHFEATRDGKITASHLHTSEDINEEEFHQKLSEEISNFKQNLHEVLDVYKMGLNDIREELGNMSN